MLPERFSVPGAVTDWSWRRTIGTRERLRLAERARGFLRAAPRSDGRGVPVLAYDDGGAETLGGAGVCWSPKDLEFAAELLGQLAFDPVMRAKVVAAQPTRLEIQRRDSVTQFRREPSLAVLAQLHRRLRQIVKLAFVVQRYGTEILGGSEYHCRLVAERLAPKHEVEVLTTCARDYITWKNEYPEGAGSHPRRHGPPLRGQRDARHQQLQPVSRTGFQQSAHARRRDGVAAAAGALVAGAHRLHQRHHSSYDALIFFTYLYAPTVLGLQIAPGRSILVPTAHDEPAIHLGIYKESFTLPAAIAYNTEVERRFLRRTSRLRAIAEETVGCGVDLLHGARGGAEAERRAGPLDELDLADAKDDDQPLPPHICGPRRDVPPAPSPARIRSRCTAAASIRARAARS